MKKTVTFLTSLLLMFVLAACGSRGRENSSESSVSAGESHALESTEESSMQQNDMTTEKEEEREEVSSKTLVVYYTSTGNTERVAGYIADATEGELFKLVPANPYSDEDLNWRDKDSRVSREHDNPEAREIELIEATVSDWNSYDTIYIGYPIWWGIAAWPVDSFIEANDFTGKTVIPFCTSSSSDLGESGELLAEAAGSGNWLEGERFQSKVSEETVREWIESLGL